MNKCIYDNIIFEFESLIETTVEDHNLRSLVIDFLHKNKLEFNPDNKFFTTEIYNISAFIEFVFAISLINKIDDLNWNFICYIYNNLAILKAIALNSDALDDRKVILGKFKSFVKQKNTTGAIKIFNLFSEFYKYVYDLKKYNHLQNIKEIGYYSNHLIQAYKSSYKLIEVEIEDENFFKKVLYSNFPIGSRYQDIITITGGDNFEDKNYHIPLTNNFIKDIISKFLDKFKMKDNTYTTRLRIFLYFFIESCNNNIPKSLMDFNDHLFEIQFNYFDNLDSKHKFIKHDKREPMTILLYFYRYLGNLSDTSNESTGLSKSLLRAFELKNFIKYYRKGYKFMYHNKHEPYPLFDKVCLLPTTQSMNNASTSNTKALYYDVSDIDPKYREHVKDFLWNNNGNTNSIISQISNLKSFFNIKQSFDMNYYDFNSTYEFDDEFLSYYRNVVELDYPNAGGLKGVLKIIRKYLKFHSDTYNVTKSHLDILNLKNLGERKGGTIITDHDIEVIYKEFEKLEKGSNIGRLQTLVFEIFIHTSIRIGSILNLTRDCLEYHEDGTVTLTYLAKKSNQEYITELVNPPIVEIIEEALSLTKSFVSNSNHVLNNYIFVHEYHSNHRYGLKRLDFYNYFKDIVESLNDKLDRSDYYPYNIRHTYINNAFKNGTKLGLDINELSAITNISYKTANAYYRDFNDTISLYVEAISKVRLNDVAVNGEIICNKDENNDGTKPVKDNLGDCKSDNCILDSGECLSCDSFVTFLNRIPKFEEAILNCNSKIEGADNPLVKEFYTTQKKLLAAYLAEMIRLDKKRGN